MPDLNIEKIPSFPPTPEQCAAATRVVIAAATDGDDADTLIAMLGLEPAGAL